MTQPDSGLDSPGTGGNESDITNRESGGTSDEVGGDVTRPIDRTNE